MYVYCESYARSLAAMKHLEKEKTADMYLLMTNETRVQWTETIGLVNKEWVLYKTTRKQGQLMM